MMNVDRWRRIKEIFQAAVQHDPGEREEVLDAACKDDPELREEVENLLSSHADSTGFMELPTGAGLLDDTPVQDLSATRIGRFLIEETISSGGMGTVYKAVQEQPHRTVAIKVMRAGIASRSALRRFEYEAEILGRLTHPHIARVIEAGTRLDDGGVPYFVMEYIKDALSITDYARQNKLSTAKRLALFLQVCDAVHHGHQKGIIHRDLKPNNILVDAQGQVKIIDFGVARSTDADLALTTAQTDVGQLLGTVQYMSPEQCKADPNDLDTRSDVYALGVVLYELLCGKLPYDVRKAVVFEATRIIREVEPKRPSTVDRKLRGDVETIVLRALEKERAHRYQSVMEFGADIRRYLEGDLIRARPAGPVTRMMKRVRRNPVVSGSVGVVFIMAVAFVGYLLFVSLPQLKRERDLAETQRLKALEAEQTALQALGEAEEQRRIALEAKILSEEEAENIKTVNKYLEEMISSADPFREGGEVKVLEMLDRAAERIDKEFPDRPEIEASLRNTLGLTFFNNGHFDRAEVQLGKALEIRRRVLGPEDVQTLFTMNCLGALLRSQGRLPEAESILQESLETSGRIFGEEHRVTLHAMNGLALVWKIQGKFSEAETMQRAVLETHIRILGPEHLDTLMAMNNLALTLETQNKPEEAGILLRDVVELRTRVLGPEHPNTLNAMSNLAMVFKAQGKLSEAEDIYTATLETQTRILGREHPNTLNTMHNLAIIVAIRGEQSEAEKMYSEILEIRLRIQGGEHPDTLMAMNNLAMTFKMMGKLSDAEVMIRDVLKGRTRVLGPLHPDTLSAMYNLASTHSKMGNLDEAETLYRKALKGRSTALGEEHLDTLMAMNNLALVLRDRGNLDESMVFFEQGLGIAKKTLPDGHRLIAFFHMNYGACLKSLDRYEEAEEHLLEGYRIFKTSQGEKHPWTRDACTTMVQLYDAWGKADQAEDWRDRLQ